MSNPIPPAVFPQTTTTPAKPTLSLAPSTSTPSSTHPSTYLFLLLLALLLFLITFYLISRRHRARALAARHAGVRALALDVEALTGSQHPRTLSPSTPLPPRGWRFARLLRLPTRRRVVDEDADWELDVDEVGRAPPPYVGEWKEGRGDAGLPAYEEVCGGAGVGVVGGTVDEVGLRRSEGEGLRVPERVARRGSEGDWRGGRRGERDLEEERRRESA
ncbi:hypothetical protein VC83_03078 [Pseudogymnoascus destructans]|uniref:Uncharacterized protein n=1 Tax=Pseudogymnoascus destructans TaxID=655981 RepID=A0A177ACS1_9PEZI|nr:uncharacterized protein VC83_03078 [Pseudogymnoascus destructans]OAF59888.1 hypothetical protein VC83_03078 [Pseudogymnoascus destructans]